MILQVLNTAVILPPVFSSLVAELQISSSAAISSLMDFDYIVTFSKSISDQLSHLLSFFSFLSEVDALLKLKNCFFFDNEIDYLVHVVKRGRYAFLDEATDVICGVKQPRKAKKKEVRSWFV